MVSAESSFGLTSQGALHFVPRSAIKQWARLTLVTCCELITEEGYKLPTRHLLLATANNLERSSCELAAVNTRRAWDWQTRKQEPRASPEAVITGALGSFPQEPLNQCVPPVFAATVMISLSDEVCLDHSNPEGPVLYRDHGI